MPLYKDSYSQLLDANGKPYVGAKLYLYDAGTSTPKDSFTTHALNVANPNPVVADGAGRFPAIWLGNGRYKVVAKTAAEVTIYTADGIEGADQTFNVLTTRGDLLTHSGTANVRLPIGAAGRVLGSNGTDPLWTTAPALNAANVWTQTQTIRLSDDGAGEGPYMILDRLSASPAAMDVIGTYLFQGRDSGGAEKTYANVIARILDPTAGSEDSQIIIQTRVAGAMEARMGIGPGLAMGGALGDMGAGTINATEFYKNGLPLPLVRAWVFCDSVGNIASAYNVSSVSHGSAGTYGINFATALPNANYAVIGSGEDVSGAHQTTVGLRLGDTKTTVACVVRVAQLNVLTDSRFSVAFLST